MTMNKQQLLDVLDNLNAELLNLANLVNTFDKEVEDLIESYLDKHFYSQDLNRTLTFRQYFKELLTAMWTQGEGFSGKRPFGNSGWDFDVYAGMIKNGMVKGEVDEDGYVEWCDFKKANELVYKMIDQL